MDLIYNAFAMLSCGLGGFFLGWKLGHASGCEQGKMDGYYKGITEMADRAWAKDDVQGVKWQPSGPPQAGKLEIEFMEEPE